MCVNVNIIKFNIKNMYFISILMEILLKNIYVYVYNYICIQYFIDFASAILRNSNDE